MLVPEGVYHIHNTTGIICATLRAAVLSFICVSQLLAEFRETEPEEVTTARTGEASACGQAY